MPLLFVGPRCSTEDARANVTRECKRLKRTFGVDAFQRVGHVTESERHALSVYPASPLLPRVVRVRHGAAE